MGPVRGQLPVTRHNAATSLAGQFVVVVFDQGEPGVGDPVITGDGFSIELSGVAPYAGYTRAGYIEGGNIQVDKQ